MPLLEDVFGIRTKPVLSYTERVQVDGQFREVLKTENHIVIYGSSKQGKTALRQKHISDKDCLFVHCNLGMTTEDMYSTILRNADVSFETFENTTEHVKGGVKGKWGFKAFIPWLGGADAEGEASAETGVQKSRQREFIAYDLSNPQSIAELLKRVGCKKYLVVENFHYLPVDETQKRLAYDLKTFHELSVRFIILGVWREANLLHLYNSDLQDRISEIPVEPWESRDFDSVIALGCRELNIRIDPRICEQFKANAYGNIGMLQEFLRTFCRISGIHETQPELLELADQALVDETFARKLEDQRGQLLQTLQGIASKSRVDSDQSLILPYYLVKVILSTPVAELINGISRKQLLEKLKVLHHREDKDTIRVSDVANLLNRLPNYQMDVNTPFLHYDRNQQRLNIVNSRHFFVLANINKEEMLEEIPHPVGQSG